jgi:hypothetical protein
VPFEFFKRGNQIPIEVDPLEISQQYGWEVCEFIIGEIDVLEVGETARLGKEPRIAYYIPTYIQLTHELQFLHVHSLTELVAAQVDNPA